MKDLFTILSEVSGCQFASIVLLTNVKLPKKLGLGSVTKIFDGVVQINYSYQNAVNSRLEKKGESGDFVAEKLPWGSWEIPNKVITNKGKRYMRYYLVNNCGSRSRYYVDGREATPEEVAIIKAYQSKGYSTRQAASGLTENQVKPKVVDFDNVLEMVANGIKYEKKG